MSSRGTALVTGGAKRIGRTIALGLAEMGFDIAVHYRSSEREAREVVETIQKTGRKSDMFQADFARTEHIENLIPRVTEQFGGLTLLVNNVSIFQRGSLLETDAEQFDMEVTVNLKAPFFLTRNFARICKEGNVINLLDTKIARTLTRYFIYTLTKKALYEFTVMAAKELAPDIRVNGVAPGVILPPPGKDEAYLEERGNELPLRKTGSPEKIFDAVRYLIESDFVTGECIFIDGGEHLK